MFFKLPVTLLSAFACVALANVIPADPTITPPAILPRQLDAAWIGWVQDNGTCMHAFWQTVRELELTYRRDFTVVRCWQYVVPVW